MIMTNDLAAYFAMRIEMGKLNYNTVIAKYLDCKDGIDLILATDGYTINEDGTVTKK